jgi:ATP-dependent Clp protease ATP-binding subunit ClpX
MTSRGVIEVVVNEEAVMSDAQPLLIYADRKVEPVSAG